MPSNISITEATKILVPLLKSLEAGFWDASNIDLKDRIFDIVMCTHAEINELAKLSVSDMDMPYEPITPEFGGSCKKLSYLMANIESFFPRSTTAEDLKETLTSAATLLKHCEL